tara:strand:- start:366 stop:1442 length:1077 start_codon:yes stop_codon:yes gene_type:complete
MSITMTNNNDNAMTTLFGDLILKLFRDNGAYEIHDFGDATDVLIEVMTEEVFNNYNPEVRMAVEAKEVWTTDEFGQINTVLAEAVDEFGYDLIKDKDFIQRIELYVYLQAKEMGIELAEELKTKQEERQAAAGLVALGVAVVLAEKKQAEVRQPIKVEQRTTEVMELQHANSKLTNHINMLHTKLSHDSNESSKQAYKLHEENKKSLRLVEVLKENFKKETECYKDHIIKMEGDIKELKFKLDRSDELIKILKKEVMPIQEAIAEHEADLQQLHQEEMDTVKQELYEKYQEEEGEKIEDLTQHHNEQISDLKEELESYEEDGSSWERIRDEMRDEVEKEMVGDLADHIEEYIRERKWS